jgi:hypothetical protein
LIFKTDIPFPKPSLPQRLHEKNLYRRTFLTGLIRKYLINWEISLERSRNAAATLQNFTEALNADNASLTNVCDSFASGSTSHNTGIVSAWRKPIKQADSLSPDTGIAIAWRKPIRQADTVSPDAGMIAYCCCLPVAPFVSFGDVQKASMTEPRIIPFTSPDFTLSEYEMEKKLQADIRSGAAGVKIHPILQQADVSQIVKAVEIIAAQSPAIPVLLHTGRAVYYNPRESAREGKAKYTDYASAEKIHEIISAFRSVNFIVGHAGLSEMNTVIKLCGTYKNVYADTSFQPPAAIAALLHAFGGDKILFGSDWPYGFRKASLAAAMKACESDDALLHAVLYGNAAQLLRI